MTDMIHQFTSVVEGSNGQTYLPLIRGRKSDHGTWEGWVEFDPQDGTAMLRTARETVQHGRKDLDYWARGLTRIYLEGAIQRARPG